ncbi:MAG TPA: histidine phosphatase family protein [Xanthobacteraceae bacterium]|jgi:probable phosphoglycerate mutase|nr:histidine phosphatase family protein [Xanthobacteraceae bacterium]
MLLYYVRHGLTDWNIAGRLQGHRDIPLNQTGRAQAAHCGELLRDLFARDDRAAGGFDYVSSPLSRARDTMEIMRVTLGLAPAGYAIEPRLAEIGFGEWEGLTYDEVMRRDADVVARREADKWEFVPPGGENYRQVALRVGGWYATLARDTVVCAHGGTGRALIALLGMAPPEQAVHEPIDQSVVYVLEQSRLIRYE